MMARRWLGSFYAECRRVLKNVVAQVTGSWKVSDKSVHHRTWNNVKLQAKNGVPNRIYSFKQMRYTGQNGNNYSQTSIKGCAKNGAGWKPVCDHRHFPAGTNPPHPSLSCVLQP